MAKHKFQETQEDQDQIHTTSGNISSYSSDFYQEERRASCPACEGIGWVYGEDNETCILCNGGGLL